MNYKLAFASFAAAMMAFAACQEKAPAPTIAVDPSTVSAVAAGATQTLKITANGPWTATSTESWASVSPAEGGATTTSATITVLANTAASPRTATVSFTNGSASATVTVSQEAAQEQPGPGPEPQPEPSDKSKIGTAAEFVAFMEDAKTALSSETFTLTADIDLSGVSVPSAESFSGTLDGAGKTIKGLSTSGVLITALAGTIKDINFSSATLGGSLVGQIGDAGKVSGLDFDSSSTVSFPEPAEAASFGTVAGVNYGIVEDCTFDGTIDLKYATLPSKQECNWGGLVGYTVGQVKDCLVSGKVAINVAVPEKSTFHTFGGIVGMIEGTAGQVIVSGCTNTGTVSVEYGSSVYFYTGGIVGGTPSAKNAPGDYGIIANCTNEGDVSMAFPTGGSGSYPNCGGIVGFAEAAIRGCTNKGTVSLVSEQASSPWTSPRLGGVAGVATRGVSDCHNYGKIVIKGLFAGGTDGNRGSGNVLNKAACFAGVVAAAGPYETGDVSGANMIFEDCTNEGDFTLDFGTTTETPNTVVGGVFGFVTGQLKNCENKGKITLNSPAAVNRLGGIAGMCKYNVSDCKNSGALTINSAPVTTKTWVGYVGGITADVNVAGASAALVYSNCTNSGALTYSNTSANETNRTSAVAGILATSKAGATVDFPGCSNTGKLTASTVQEGACVTADLRGTDYYN